jgi:Protein of unknown function (DUF3168)
VTLDTQVSFLIDIHGLLVRYLRADPGVSAICGARIYARNYHERQALPACRITFPVMNGVTVPAPAWWVYEGQVDCHADTHQQALGLVREVERALRSLEGTTQPEGRVQVVDAWSVQSGFDEEWTPPKPRWIVAAAVTARPREE